MRDALHAWPGRDVADAVAHLPPDSATARAELGDLFDWNHLAANVAELVDISSYWLEVEYAKWTHDPDDPASRRAKRDRKRPPPVPIIPPVAHRPPSVAERYRQTYADLLAQHDPAPVTEWLSSDEFDQRLGLV